MRIAVISDIHGNLAALDAVLADAAARGADAIVNLGDILSGPLQPAATADRLVDLDLPTIRGNHERYLMEREPARLASSDAYAHAELSAAHRAWLAALPTSMWVTGEVFACHGTPRADDEGLLETVEPAGAREATDAEVAARAGGTEAAVILCGHTHKARRRHLADGRLVVNPGSVGLPAYAADDPFAHKMESGTPHARYAVLERAAGGWSAELLMVDYDWTAAAQLAAARGRPDWARALATGLA